MASKLMTCLHKQPSITCCGVLLLLSVHAFHEPQCLQQLWRYNTHAVEMRIDYLNSMTGAGTEAQTVMVNDIPEVNKVTFAHKHCIAHALCSLSSWLLQLSLVCRQSPWHSSSCLPVCKPRSGVWSIVFYKIFGIVLLAVPTI